MLTIPLLLSEVVIILVGKEEEEEEEVVVEGWQLSLAGIWEAAIWHGLRGFGKT